MLGGLLLQHFSWHSVFWINVPAVCVTLAAGAVLMPGSRNPAAPPLDAPGALLSAGAVTGLVWGVINGQEHGWTAPPDLGVLLAGSARERARRTRSSPGAVPGQAVDAITVGHDVAGRVSRT